MNPSELRDIFRFDWGITPSGRCLHYVYLTDYDPDHWNAWEGGSVCGVQTTWAIPGIVSRMEAPRCARCCDLLGIKRGVGSPKNDPELREWVKERK